MTEQEAIKRSKEFLKDNILTVNEQIALGKAIEALEKQIPSKPIEIQRQIFPRILGLPMAHR